VCFQEEHPIQILPIIKLSEQRSPDIKPDAYNWFYNPISHFEAALLDSRNAHSSNR
jgi:pullulanase/glycogen debranching enzyme